MPLTRYHFSKAISAFFEMSAEGARSALPKHLEPLEPRYSRGVFAVTAFDFTESMVGKYQEIVLAVISPPLVRPGESMPRSAFFPFLVGTSSEASRLHAIERWHLPHYMKDIGIEFDEKDGRVRVSVWEGDTPILEFAVSEHEWSTVDHPYQCFMIDGADKFKVDIHMKGSFSEHEEETGELNLHDHPMCEKLLAGEVESYPFRELWMKDGMQTFEELETL